MFGSHEDSISHELLLNPHVLTSHHAICHMPNASLPLKSHIFRGYVFSQRINGVVLSGQLLQEKPWTFRWKNPEKSMVSGEDPMVGLFLPDISCILTKHCYFSSTLPTWIQHGHSKENSPRHCGRPVFFSSQDVAPFFCEFDRWALCMPRQERNGWGVDRSTPMCRQQNSLDFFGWLMDVHPEI